MGDFDQMAASVVGDFDHENTKFLIISKQLKFWDIIDLLLT